MEKVSGEEYNEAQELIAHLAARLAEAERLLRIVYDDLLRSPGHSDSKDWELLFAVARFLDSMVRDVNAEGERDEFKASLDDERDWTMEQFIVTSAMAIARDRRDAAAQQKTSARAKYLHDHGLVVDVSGCRACFQEGSGDNP